MAALDPVVFRQFPLIQKIIADETWLEGERRGRWVPSDDPVVRENVCQVILRVGAEMRETLAHELAGVPQSCRRTIARRRMRRDGDLRFATNDLRLPNRSIEDAIRPQIISRK